jgi:hypothetical protein
MSLFSRLRRLGRRDRSYVYPLERRNDRIFPPGYSGIIYVWDIDKTYLESDFDSWLGMLKIPFEFAVDKRSIAGADQLLRAIRRPEEGGPSSGLYFVSASPNGMRKTIEKKMLLDGVEHDGITLKDWRGIVRSGRVAKLREQVGYKLSALLLGRRDLGWKAKEILFGDDSESDALSYGLYADIVAGRLRGEKLAGILRKNGVSKEDAHYVADLSADLPPMDLVERIYIHLEKGTRASAFDEWGPRLVPCRGTFQMAACLVRDGQLAVGALADQAEDLMTHHSLAADDLLERLGELNVSGQLNRQQSKSAIEELLGRALVSDDQASRAIDALRDTESGGEPGEMVTPERYLV